MSMFIYVIMYTFIHHVTLHMYSIINVTCVIHVIVTESLRNTMFVRSLRLPRLKIALNLPNQDMVMCNL